MDPSLRDSTTSTPSHAAFSAMQAIEVKNHSTLNGKVIRVLWSRRDPDIRKNCIGNVFGKIVSLAISKDENGMSKGFGFVNYENPDDAKRALEAMNGTQLGSFFLHPFTVLVFCRHSWHFLMVHDMVLICLKQVRR
ncbi:polyadenylate-binding protein 7-like [Lotus japonicus]|uniref:polyadenylate-binding protein 7-like n=1 Tax=Lotus japonicus TaxID=34305 RepID=UPI00258C9BCB|nr:polyadenylate-binding protein 7-like [Lotus japonicus]